MSQKIRIAFFAVTMLGLGALLDHLAIAKSERHQESVISTESNESLDSVSPEEIREYLRTKNADEKLQKAELLLAKMIQVFVADLGLHLSHEELAQLQAPTKLPVSRPSPTPPSVPNSEEMKPKNLNPQIRQFRVEILAAKDQTEAQNLMENLTPEKFASRIQSSTQLQPDQVKALNGHFKGRIEIVESFSSQRSGPFSVEIQFQGELQRSEVNGTAFVTMTNSKGKQFSRGRSRGDLGKNYSSSHEAILISVGGDYLELAYFPQFDQLIGNYYESEKGSFQLVGRAVLSRQQ